MSEFCPFACHPVVVVQICRVRTTEVVSSDFCSVRSKGKRPTRPKITCLCHPSHSLSHLPPHNPPAPATLIISQFLLLRTQPLPRAPGITCLKSSFPPSHFQPDFTFYIRLIRNRHLPTFPALLPCSPHHLSPPNRVWGLHVLRLVLCLPPCRSSFEGFAWLFLDEFSHQ